MRKEERASAGHPKSAATSRQRRPRVLRVLLVDDHTILRETLRLLLQAHTELEIVGEAGDGYQAIELAEQLRPDVILMDTAMPGLNGIDATQAIHRRTPRAKIIMLSGYGYEERVTAALRAGASGYVLKSAGSAELLAAIKAVCSSSAFFTAEHAGRLQSGQFEAAAATVESQPLSAREREVLQLVAEGLPNGGIAERLFISIKTVEAHKEHIMRKLGVRGTAGLIHYAIRKGVIQIETDASLGFTDAG